MANVYSVLLWRGGPTSAGTTLIGPSPPAGYVWVVRDVQAVNTGVGEGTGVYDFALTVNGNWPLANAQPGGALAGNVYGRELHQVLGAGDQLELLSFSAGWLVNVSGYRLTLP